jgi:hypothetical protein
MKILFKGFALVKNNKIIKSDDDYYPAAIFKHRTKAVEQATWYDESNKIKVVPIKIIMED